MDRREKIESRNLPISETGWTLGHLDKVEIVLTVRGVGTCLKMLMIARYTGIVLVFIKMGL